MKVSYGIRWQAIDRERSGRLSVGESGLTLVDARDLAVREIPYGDIREVGVHEVDGGLVRLDILLTAGEMVECETAVARWILEALAGKVPVVDAHELHAGLGL